MQPRSHRGATGRRRTRRLALSIGVVAGCALVGLGSSALAAVTANPPDHPEITFTDLDGQSAACDSVPAVTSITIHRRTRLDLINATGAEVILDAGQESGWTIPDGGGASLRLRHGQHAIRLIPDCGAIGTVEPLVVTVTTGREAPTGAATAPPVVETGGSAESGSASGAAVASQPPQPVGSANGRGALAGGAGSTPRTAHAAVASRGQEQAAQLDAIEDFMPLSLADSEKGASRLLVIIAAICVFGVSWAIIRATLAQSSPTVTGPSQRE